MRTPSLPLIVACALLSGCAGAGSSVSPAIPSRVASPSASPAAADGATSFGTITIFVGANPRTAIGFRKPAYVSLGTTRAALFIDGATTPAGVTTACVASMSSGASCTISWSAALTVPAAHTFAVEIDDGTTVLAESKASYGIHAGGNTLSVLTLSGVAGLGAVSGETCAASTCSGTLTLADAAVDAIDNTTSPLVAGYDNGPLTFASTATGVGTVTSAGTITQPPASGTVAYTVRCVASTGTFLTTLAPGSTTGSGAITSAEVSGRGLVYPTSIGLASNTYACSTGTTITSGLPRLYVGYGGPGSVRVFATSANGAAATVATIGGGSTGITQPQGVGLDSGGRVYVSDSSNASIRVFAPNPVGAVTGAPVATISGAATTLSNCVNVVMDASGRVFVTNDGTNSILVFPSGPIGSVTSAPVATIGGGSTGISSPIAAAFDSSGRLYVANYGGSNIAVFAANPVGNVTSAPVATIGGGSTGINTPFGVALDAKGRVYVANLNGNSITVYAPNPVGSVTTAPVATIGGGSTGINSPVSVALDASGRVYVSNNNANATIAVFAANPVGNVTTAPIAVITGITAPFALAIR